MVQKRATNREDTTVYVSEDETFRLIKKCAIEIKTSFCKLHFLNTYILSVY